MNDLPIHPAVVHVPVGLALVLPLLAAGLAWAVHVRRGLPRQAWGVVVLMLGLMLGGALTAMQTGEDEEERVEAVVPESAIETHEEAAEIFTWGIGVVLAVSLAALLIPSARASSGLAAATVAGSLVLVVLAYRTGHAGGSILHRHLVRSEIAMPAAGAASAPAGGHAEDDD